MLPEDAPTPAANISRRQQLAYLDGSVASEFPSPEESFGTVDSLQLKIGLSLFFQVRGTG